MAAWSNYPESVGLSRADFAQTGLTVRYVLILLKWPRLHGLEYKVINFFLTTTNCSMRSLVPLAIYILYRHESFSTKLPDPGVVDCLSGSLSQVTWPLKMRMYLYWNVMLAGKLTVALHIG